MVGAVVLLGMGVAPESSWAGSTAVPAMSSLWREHFEPIEPPAETPPPPVHAEPPPPPKTALIDPVLPEYEPVPDAQQLAEAEFAEHAAHHDEAPTPDWSARVAAKPKLTESEQKPPAEASSAPSSDGALVQPSPLPGKNPPPEYPRAARRSGIEGEVTVILEIAADGRVDAAHVEKSSGSSLLDDAALHHLSKWTFEPARRAGVAVRGTYRTVVEFAID